MGERIRSFDWGNHPLGAPETWPQSLKTTLRILLGSRYAMWMGWGPELYFFCNDAYLPTVGSKERWVLGASARKAWEEVWSDIGPRVESVVQTGEATWDESLMLLLERHGYAEETYHTFSCSPVPDDSGAIGGMLCVATEETERVIGERRLALLHELATAVGAMSTEAEFFQGVRKRLEACSRDLPFALIYLFEPGSEQARLVCAAGAGEGAEIAPPFLALGAEGSIWAGRELLDGKGPILVDLTAQTSMPSGPWSIPPRQAVLAPLVHPGQERPAGFLVAAVNPCRPFDDDYSGFVTSLAGQLAAAISDRMSRACKEASQLQRDLRQEAELAQKQTATILESIGDGFISLNSEWRYIYVNAQAERLLSIPRAGLMGRNVWEVFPGVIGTPLEAALRRVMHERASVNIVHYDPDRDWWVEQRIFPADDGGVSVYFRDITEEKAAEQKLRASEDRYRQLIRSLPAAVYTCDVQGRITLYNDAAVTLWGRRPDLHRDRWCGSFRLYREDGTPMRPEENPMALVLNGGDSHDLEPLIVERPDGSRRTVLPHPRPIRSAAGVLAGAVNMLVDITERKQIEAILKEAKETAEAANTAKDRFLAVLSHELRTPLTPVLMTVSAMDMNDDLPAPMRDDLRMIRRNVELETKLIDDLLDLSRITSGKLRLQPQSIDLNEVVRHVAGICRPQLLEKAIRLHAELDPAMPRVNADPARLQQILWNILKNSAKFTPEGGHIFLRTSICRSGAAQISVRDTGIGIPPEILPRVFDAFEQGEASITRQFGGLGLGLAISKALIEMHGGAIFATSEGQGKGSTFVIELPVREALPVDRPAVPRRDSLKTAHPLRLLVVEDHADTARVLKKLLSRLGYNVEVASTVAAALKAAAAETFDIVISDIGLPDGTGYELMKRLQENPRTLAIAMSGFGMDEDIRKSREAGFLEHLVKPVDIEQLRAALGRLKKLRGK